MQSKPSSKFYCVYRGGGWPSAPAFTQVANRNRPGRCYRRLGFRLVRIVSALELLIMNDCHE